MSVFSGIENQNKIFKISQSSTATLSSSQYIYVTLPNWPSYSVLKNIFVTANKPFSNLTITILTDGAAFRGAEPPAQYPYVQKSITDNSTNIYGINLDMSSVYIENAGDAGYLYIQISSGTAFETGTIFNIVAEGSQMLPPDSDSLGNTGNMVKKDPYYRILRVSPNDSVSHPSVDLTGILTGNGVSYTLNRSPSTPILNSNADYLYIGSTQPISTLNFIIPQASDLGDNSNLAVEIWNGTSWVVTPFQDNTSDGQSDASSWSYSGVINVLPNNAWRQTHISTDPLKIYSDQVANGTAYPLGFSYGSPARYWIRLSVPSLQNPMYVTAIQQVGQTALPTSLI